MSPEGESGDRSPLRFAPLTALLSSEEQRTLAQGPSLCDLFRKHLPTKQGHNYAPLYERHFSRVRLDARRVLEIGVQAGTSLRLWKDFFPNAKIYGFDIDPRSREHIEDRIEIVVGDQTDPADLNALPDGFDVIIDDGLHTAASQLATFRSLYRTKLGKRGIYVVEDIGEDGVGPTPVLTFFSRLSALLNFWPRSLSYAKWSSFDTADWFGKEIDELSDEDAYFVKNTLGVAIYRHIVFVDKGRNPEDGQAAFRTRHRDLWRATGQTCGAWLNRHD